MWWFRICIYYDGLLLLQQETERKLKVGLIAYAVRSGESAWDIIVDHWSQMLVGPVLFWVLSLGATVKKGDEK